jgi:signal recognition particle GTPase
MQSKFCSRCGIEKSFDEFYKEKKSKDGKRSECNICTKDVVKKYKENNKEKVKKRMQKYYQNNRDYLDKKNKQWLENNKEKVNERQRHRDTKRRSDPEKRFLENLSDLFRKNIKCTETRNIFEFVNVDKLIYLNHIKKSEYWDDYCSGKKIDIDHIIPKNIFNRLDFNEVKKCWHYENLRLIPEKENLEKAFKVDMQLIEKHKIKHLLPENYASS